MKQHISLERYNNHFYSLQPDTFEDLRYFVEFLSTDYRNHDQKLFNQAISFYNSSFVYHDFSHDFLYIGFSEWEIKTEIPVPCDHAFPDYVHEMNSCKIDVENFKNFVIKWTTLKKKLSPFAIIYRNDSDLIDCKAFNSKEEMELFIKNY